VPCFRFVTNLRLSCIIYELFSFNRTNCAWAPDTVGEGIVFSSCPSVRSFVRTDLVTMISHEWLEEPGRHVVFLNFKFVTVGTVKKVKLRHIAKFRRNRSNLGRDMAIFPFFQDVGRPPSCICVACWDHPRREFGGLYHCTKFGWNRCSSFDNMHVFHYVDPCSSLYLCPKFIAPLSLASVCTVNNTKRIRRAFLSSRWPALKRSAIIDDRSLLQPAAGTCREYLVSSPLH